MKKHLMAMVFGSALVLGACGQEEADFEEADELTEDAPEEDPIEEETEEAAEEVVEEDAEEDVVAESPDDAVGEDDAEGDAGSEGVATVDAEQIIQQNCSSCHGADLAGVGGIPALNDVGSRLSSDEILTVIHEGPGAMPADIITGAEAEAVAEYLSTLQ